MKIEQCTDECALKTYISPLLFQLYCPLTMANEYAVSLVMQKVFNREMHLTSIWKEDSYVSIIALIKLNLEFVL